MTSPPVARSAWTHQQERSNRAILKLMVWISLFFGRTASRLVVHGIAGYFLLFSPTARRASTDYLNRALGRPAGLADVYRHIFTFASTIHDRLYFLTDRHQAFDLDIRNVEAIHHALEDQGGVLLIGAHLGSFEVLRALGRARAGLRCVILMYEENARKINSTLAAINPAASHDIIALGHMDSMLKTRDCLDEGCLVGMLADRRLTDDDATVDCEFLGKMASFPVGPWRMAAMLRRPVFFMTGLYLGGNRYQLHFEPLADFSQTPRETREAAIHAAMQHYADRLSHFCRQAPYNWFNFFDFWQKK